MSEFIDRKLKAPKHEEQAYNSCAGILHSVKELPHGIVEEAAAVHPGGFLPIQDI